MRRSLSALALGLLWPSLACAHVSEQGFVLLLPTTAYIWSGVAVVALTVLAVLVLPDAATTGIFAWRPFAERPMTRARLVASLLSLAAFMVLVGIGLGGPRDPLENLLSLGFWTVGWIGVVALSAVVGDLWAWIEPWSGLHRLVGPARPLVTLPERLGRWPAALLMTGFGLFMLADLAPADPERLAIVLGAYWVLTMVGVTLCGPRWLEHAEIGTAIFRTYGSLAALRLRRPAGLGVPGWQLAEVPPIPGAGGFVLTLLAIGSFDGINETFTWFGLIGINPLEFPGRSAVVTENVVGLLATVAALMAVFAAVVWLGRALARDTAGFAGTFNQLAVSLAPIALAYHVGHYLTSFLVNVQYLAPALSDPLETGADFLGVSGFHVTTGFLKRIDTVRVIWLSQAAIIVLGHVWSVLLGHRIALRIFPTSRKALLATLPLSLLMVGYTFLGLWLLATPRGV